MKQSAAQHMRNRAVKSHMNKSIRALRKTTDKAEAENMLRHVFSLIDKAAKKKVIHKNKAARDKSRLAAYVSRLSN